jgi:acetyl esterase
VRTLGYRLDEPERLPLFVNMHGGGFILGNPEMDDPFMPRVAAEAGVKILNVDYALAPQEPFPKAVDEVYAVIKYAQQHADELGIDPERIAIGGHSAGGNLSAAVCLMNAERGELNLKCAILDYPPLDIYTDPDDKPKGKGLLARVFMGPKTARLFNACYCNDLEGRKNPLVSPVFASKEALKAFPPTLILTAGMDSLCAEAEKFRDMLIKAGIDVTHKRFEKSPHGFTLSDKPDAQEGWTMMIAHLRKYLLHTQTV